MPGPYDDPEEANTGWRNDYDAWDDVRNAIREAPGLIPLQQSVVAAESKVKASQSRLDAAREAFKNAPDSVEMAKAEKDVNVELALLKQNEESLERAQTQLSMAQRTIGTRQDRPVALPRVQTSAEFYPRWNPIKQEMEWLRDPNYRPPRETGGSGGSGAALLSAQLAAERFAWDKAKYEAEEERKRELDERSWNEGVGPGYERQKAIDYENWLKQEEFKRTNSLEDQRRAAEEAWKATLYQQEQTNERNRLSSQVSLSDSIARNWLSALPYAATPGQTHFLGFEPGGPYEQLVKMGGGQYSGDTYRAPIKEYDYGNSWRQAAGMVGR